MALPLTVLSWVFAEPLIGLLTDDPAVIGYGSRYLGVIMLSLAPRFWSMIAARALAGSADTRTPMDIRVLTLPTNVVLNAVLVFGLGPVPRLGVLGAALGTVIANTVAASAFLVLLVSGRYAVSLPVQGRQVDVPLLRELVRVATPLGGMRLVQSTDRFPFLFVLSAIGIPVVSAFAIGRRVMLLALMPAWGYATAASTLVGQSLGAGDADEAADYGWQTLRIGLATQLLIAAVLVAFARPIAAAFGTQYVGLTVDFIRMFGVTTAGFSLARTMRGSLRGAGDTRWPFYWTVAGSDAVRLRIAVLALPHTFTLTVGGFSVVPGLGLGVPAIFAAVLADHYVKAAVNTGRFYSGAWRAIAQRAPVGG